MTYAFPPGDRPSIPIHGSAALFPIHRIYCVGRNYAEHAREMGADPDREPPFFFSKPADAAVFVTAASNSPTMVPYPSRTSELHHEIELVVAIGLGGSNIPVATAPAHVFGFAVGIDLTRRDLQNQAKGLGRPWDTGKGFDCSAPLGAIHTLQETGWLDAGRIWLTVNGEPRQQGDITDMIWNIAEVIAELSTLYQLMPGDLVFTGTPAGVGAVQRGDLLQGGVDGVGNFSVRIE